MMGTFPLLFCHKSMLCSFFYTYGKRFLHNPEKCCFSNVFTFNVFVIYFVIFLLKKEIKKEKIFPLFYDWERESGIVPRWYIGHVCPLGTQKPSHKTHSTHRPVLININLLQLLAYRLFVASQRQHSQGLCQPTVRQYTKASSRQAQPYRGRVSRE